MAKALGTHQTQRSYEYGY